MTSEAAARPTTPNRILMGVPSTWARGGGPALHLPMLVEDLRLDGRCSVRTFSFGRWAEHEPLARKLWHQLVDLIRYPRVLRDAAPDLVHLNTSFDRRAIARDLAFAAVTRLQRRRLLLKWHGSETQLLRSRSPLWRFLSRRLLACTDAIAVLSTEEARDLRAAGYRKRVCVVRNGLDLSRYSEVCDVRPKLGLPPGSRLLLFIARLIPEKGLLDTIEALHALGAAPDVHLIVVGDGPSALAARELVRQLELTAHVHFVGTVSEDEAATFYRSCDILVLPTFHAEGFPMSIFQGVASGMSVVTTRIRAAADYLTEPANCLFVPPKNPAALARALATLLDDDQLRASMRRNNRALAERFERHRVAAEFAALYTELLGAVTARTGPGESGS